jgi:transcriptional regulator NrdR family protein
MDVKKKSGKTEQFMPEKIVVALVKAGAPYDTAKQIAQSVSAKPVSTMKTSDIREEVLKQLKAKNLNSVAAHWETYDKEKKKPGKK